VGATAHICAQDPNKVRLIRDAKQLMDKSMNVTQQAQAKTKKEEDTLSNTDFAEIITTISETVRLHLEMCTANLKQASNAAQQQQQRQPADEQDKVANEEWQNVLDSYLEEEKQWSAEAQRTQARLNAKEWTPDEYKTAVDKFKEVRRTITMCMEAASGSEEKETADVIDQEVIWTSLVKCLVLQHKRQGAAVVLNVGQAISDEQQETLRSIAHDEIAIDFHKTPGESIFDFAAKLQDREALSNWIVQSLLPPLEVAGEQYRIDGTLFRVLKKNLPQYVSWAAQIVASEATREKRRGGTFQQLVAKVYEAGEGESEGDGKPSSLKQDGKPSSLKRDGKPSSLKSISFVATKGKLKRNPQAKVTREERRALETKTIYKPKKRKAKDSESDDDDVSVNLIDSENDDSHLDSLVGMIKGLQKQMNKLSNSAPTHSWQQRDQQQQQDDFQRHQRSTAGSWNQNDHYPPDQRRICRRFLNTGTCEFIGCEFAHSDEGNTAAMPRHQGPGVPQMHAQRQANLQHQQNLNDNLILPCFAFQRGHCNRNMCRFSHNQQNQQQHQQQRQVQRAADMPPDLACRSMWASSTCDNYRCTFNHGSFDSRGNVCKSFLMQTHCPFLFSNKGCKFSHLAQEQDAKQLPLDGARSQRELLSEATPEQEDN
jgi:hypothetical protein